MKYFGYNKDCPHKSRFVCSAVFLKCIFCTLVVLLMKDFTFLFNLFSSKFNILIFFLVPVSWFYLDSSICFLLVFIKISLKTPRFNLEKLKSYETEQQTEETAYFIRQWQPEVSVTTFDRTKFCLIWITLFKVSKFYAFFPVE